MSVRTLRDLCHVRLEAQAHIHTTLLLPESVRKDSTKPFVGKLLSCGPGRRAGPRSATLVPTIYHLIGDPALQPQVVALHHFARSRHTDLGDGCVLLHDYDILAFMRDGELVPNWGRVLLEREATAPATRKGIHLLTNHTPEHARYKVAKVLRSQKWLDERFGDVAKGEKSETLEFSGIRESSLAPGQFVLYDPFNAWAVEIGGSSYVVAEQRSVMAAVPSPDLVETL